MLRASFNAARQTGRLMTMNRALVMATQRGYFKDGVLMPREQGEYYADPMDVAERTVRLIALHDHVNDPSAITLSSSFSALGLGALDMVEVFLGLALCRRRDRERHERACDHVAPVAKTRLQMSFLGTPLPRR